MIIDITEGLSDLQLGLHKTFGVDPTIFEHDHGKELLMTIAVTFIRRAFLHHITNIAISEAALMSEIASAVYKAGENEAYTKIKHIADLVIRFENAGDDSIYDGKPEGEAMYVAGEFIEESLREIEDLFMDVVRQDDAQCKEQVFQFRIPTGPAGFTCIIGEQVISLGSVVRGACSNRKQYNDMINSIVLG